MPPALTPLTPEESALWEAFQTYSTALGRHGDRSLWWGFRHFLRRWPPEKWDQSPSWTFGDLQRKEEPIAIFLLATNRWHPGYPFLLNGTFTSLRRSLAVTPWTGILTEFLFVRHGKVLSPEYFRDGLASSRPASAAP